MDDIPEMIHLPHSDIIVNRYGKSLDSYMKTVDVIGEVKPNKAYKITNNNIILTTNKMTIYNFIPQTPPHVKIYNNWNTKTKYQVKNSNILGSFGEFTIDGELNIPISPTSAETLAFYDCELIKHNDVMKFDTPYNLPITMMEIGNNYAKEFVLTELGGGCYLEYHDTPHFHMPLSTHSNGYLILGRIIDNYCYLSAFRIPLGFAIYTKPFVIHCDAFLVGDYMVVYTVTEIYSTVLLRNNNKIANIKFS